LLIGIIHCFIYWTTTTAEKCVLQEKLMQTIDECKASAEKDPNETKYFEKLASCHVTKLELEDAEGKMDDEKLRQLVELTGGENKEGVSEALKACIEVGLVSETKEEGNTHTLMCMSDVLKTECDISVTA